MTKMSSVPCRLNIKGLARSERAREVYFLIGMGKIYLVLECGRLQAALSGLTDLCTHYPGLRGRLTFGQDRAHTGNHCWSMTSVPGGGVNRNKGRPSGTSRSM
jgi:hypothetical protein